MKKQIEKRLIENNDLILIRNRLDALENALQELLDILNSGETWRLKK